MVSDSLLQKYAALAVRTGANVQTGQLLVLTASVDCAPFVRLCVEEAYNAGAAQVQVVWTDEQVGRLRYEHEEEATLAAVADWEVARKKYQVDRGCCYLYVESDTPGLLSHIPGHKLKTANLARRTAFEPFQHYTMNNEGQWSIVGYPTLPWAKKVFPQMDDAQALDALWNAVLQSVHVREDSDPVALWARHDQALEKNAQRLNDLNFHALHFTNALGTDLTVELVKGHVWAGGGTTAKNGAFFNANMPTEEVFSMPHRLGVNGTVAATKPLNYQGKLIEGFTLTFREGRVVASTAQKGADALQNLLTADEGSCYLGEVALVPYHSPISQSGVLFLETLFDENASCHLALGEAYPENLRGGGEMTRAERTAAGANYSKEHCDFMFGSADLSVTGHCAGGRTVPVFVDGDFCEDSGFFKE